MKMSQTLPTPFSRSRNPLSLAALTGALTLALLLTLLPASPPAHAQRLPCKPCAGLLTDDPLAVVGALGDLPPALSLPDDALLAVAWEIPTTGVAAAETAARPARALARAGATPWLRLHITTPPPLVDNAAALGRELDAAARAVRRAPPGSWVQILWPGAPQEAATAAELAFLIKRASTAITGAALAAGGDRELAVRVVSPPLPADPAVLEALWAEDVAAYLDVLAVPPLEPEALAPLLDTLTRLDPGKPVAVDARPLPSPAGGALARTAADAAAGVSLTLFEADFEADPEGTGAEALAARLRPFVLLARELTGDLEFDPYSSPTGAGDTTAWAFVRGEDLALRVIAQVDPAAREEGELWLEFSDTTLREPERVPLDGSEPFPLAGVSRGRDGLTLAVADPGPVALLRLARPSFVELAGQGGLAEEVTVTSERQMPVEEILRRLQAFEDDQARRLAHYRATNRTHLRFLFGTGTNTLETTFEGDFFFRQGEGFDWAWQSFYVNGVQWRGKKIPEIPLVRPEKASALPLEILFSPEYRYRLRGTGEVDGRPVWVVDFRPLTLVEGASLYQGTVWIDRRHYTRLRTRAVQLGLEGNVISNEETLHYQPVAPDGSPGGWELLDRASDRAADRAAAEGEEGDGTDAWAWAEGTGQDGPPPAFVLPVRTTGQEVLSILNGTTVVEKETLLSDFVFNGPDFEDVRTEVMASDTVMLRDTEQGLRYLVKDKETGERVVQEEQDLTRVFLGGGVFFDDSLDFPLPLGGINYFSFDWRGTGAQVNAFFAGALLTLDYADPDLFGSRWDGGVDFFALGVQTSDELFRDNREVKAEEIEQRTGNVEFTLGRPIGQFFKFSLDYGLQYIEYDRADDTAEDFILPRDHLTQSLTLTGQYNRRGWRGRFRVSTHQRSDWEFWGLPGNTDFDPEQEDYLRWGVSLGKNWYLPKFRKVGLELEWVDGEDLDRFSKYEFGFFSDIRVHGYQSDRVRAQEAVAAHASYGFEVGRFLRLDGVLDAALADDPEFGLEDEFLAGVGIAGTFQGPWETLVNLDVGTPVAGPDSGVSVFLVFLKLTDW